MQEWQDAVSGQGRRLEVWEEIGPELRRDLATDQEIQGPIPVRRRTTVTTWPDGVDLRSLEATFALDYMQSGIGEDACNLELVGPKKHEAPFENSDMRILSKRFASASLLRQILATLSTILGLILFIGGIYLTVTERFASTELSLFGNEFSSSSIGVTMVFIGAVLIVIIFQSILRSLDRSIGRGGLGGTRKLLAMARLGEEKAEIQGLSAPVEMVDMQG